MSGTLCSELQKHIPVTSNKDSNQEISRNFSGNSKSISQLLSTLDKELSRKCQGIGPGSSRAFAMALNKDVIKQYEGIGPGNPEAIFHRLLRKL